MICSRHSELYPKLTYRNGYRHDGRWVSDDIRQAFEVITRISLHRQKMALEWLQTNGGLRHERNS